MSRHSFRGEFQGSAGIPFRQRRYGTVMYHMTESTCLLVLSDVELRPSCAVSYGSIPEYRLLFGIGWRAVLLGTCVLLPAGQDRHAILFAKALLRFLSSLYFLAQATLFLNHLKHCMVSVKPRHACHLAKKKEWIQKTNMEWKQVFDTVLVVASKNVRCFSVFEIFTKLNEGTRTVSKI